MDISIDFDGVIVEERWPEIGKLLPYAISTIRALYSAGHRIIINTCREGEMAEAVKAFLAKYDIPYTAFNENLPDRVERYGGNCRKISADVYIDDRNLGGFPGWPAVWNLLPKVSAAGVTR